MYAVEVGRSAQKEIRDLDGVVMSRVIAVLRRLGLRKPGICLLRLSRLPFDASAVAQRSLIHGVGAPVSARLVLAGADGEDGARRVSGTDDCVLRPGGAVHEVPLLQRPLLPLDD